ncbi:MAG TPA: hypothetical protein VMT27_09750 [Actinomycetes bacterium]|nr:hypothetical protein [Actinomycetes bacterium]
MSTQRHPRPPRSKAGNDFSRLRSPSTAEDRPVVQEVQTDQQGKRALFSASSPDAVPEAGAAFGAVTIDCGSCDARTVLTPAQTLAHIVPSFHMPYLKRGHGSWMHCPSCGQRTWVSVQIQL